MKFCNCGKALGKRNKYFCSRSCYDKSGMREQTQFINGHKPVRDQWGEKNAMWKGEKVGYLGVHNWVRTKLGSPNKCEHCGATNNQRYEWANKSGKYKRDLSDWLRLCCKCHFRFDKKKLGGNTRSAKSIGEKNYLNK